jgi:hypothetical protein
MAVNSFDAINIVSAVPLYIDSATLARHETVLPTRVLLIMCAQIYTCLRVVARV